MNNDSHPTAATAAAEPTQKPYPLVFHPNPKDTRIHIAKFNNLNIPNQKPPVSLTRRDLRSIPRLQPIASTTAASAASDAAATDGTDPSSNAESSTEPPLPVPLVPDKELINPSLVGPSASKNQRLAPFQKRTKEIRMVDDDVRVARREEYTPWIFHVADPLASNNLSVPVRKKYEKAHNLLFNTSADHSKDADSDLDLDTDESIVAPLDNKPLVPGANERVFVGAREDPNSEYFLFVYDTDPVPDIADHVHFNLVPVSQWFKFTERNLKTPSMSGDMAEELLKAKNSKRPGAMAKLLDRIRTNEEDQAAATLKIRSAHQSNVAGGDLDELDFDLNEEFADDEEDVVGDLEDERDGAQRQLQQMVALGLGGGEAMDDDFDFDAPEQPKLKSEGMAVRSLLRKHQSTEYTNDESSDESGTDDPPVPPATGEQPTPASVRAITDDKALAVPKKRAAPDPQPAPPRQGQDPNLQPWTGDEIIQVLTVNGSLSPGQLVQKLPNGMARYKLFGKPGLLAALKQAGASRDKNGLLQLRQAK